MSDRDPLAAALYRIRPDAMGAGLAEKAAAAARAFIGDEINADMEDTRKIWRDGKPLYDGCTHWEEGYWDGYEDSESIARGDTK